jgi:hypothetical protein
MQDALPDWTNRDIALEYRGTGAFRLIADEEWTIAPAKNADDLNDKTTNAPAIKHITPDNLPFVMSFLLCPKVPHHVEQAERTYLRDPKGRYMKSIRTGRCLVDLGDYVPHCISSKVDAHLLVTFIQYGATLSDIMDRVKPPNTDVTGGRQLTFLDDELKKQTFQLERALMNKGWRWRRKYGGMHPGTKSLGDKSGKGDKTVKDVLKKLVDDKGNLMWQKIFHVRGPVQLI